MTSLTLCFLLLKCQMIVCQSSLHSCVLGTNFSPIRTPGEIMLFGVSPVIFRFRVKTTHPKRLSKVITAVSIQIKTIESCCLLTVKLTFHLPPHLPWSRIEPGSLVCKVNTLPCRCLSRIKSRHVPQGDTRV